MISRRHVLSGLALSITGCSARQTAYRPPAQYPIAPPPPDRASLGLDAVIDISRGVTVSDFRRVRQSGMLGVIHKASEGGDYADTAYATRRPQAEAAGLLWGAYHLGRPGNPVDQANHFLDYAKPGPDEMMVLDIEGIDPEQFMSLADAQIFAGHIRTRTGRYPVLYTNHSTARHIAANRSKYRILSRLPLWYARYKPDIRSVFPLGNWDNYALWQFSAAANCNKRRCPYRVKGTLSDIDVNVAPMNRAALTKIWAFGDLVPEKPLDTKEPPIDEIVTASVSRGAAAPEPQSIPVHVKAEVAIGLVARAGGRVVNDVGGDASLLTASTADSGAAAAGKPTGNLLP